jgi:hypothetical protein
MEEEEKRAAARSKTWLCTVVLFIQGFWNVLP